MSLDLRGPRWPGSTPSIELDVHTIRSNCSEEAQVTIALKEEHEYENVRNSSVLQRCHQGNVLQTAMVHAPQRARAIPHSMLCKMFSCSIR